MALRRQVGQATRRMLGLCNFDDYVTTSRSWKRSPAESEVPINASYAVFLAGTHVIKGFDRVP